MISQNVHVLAFAYPVVWNLIGNMLLEGNAYDIQNFVVREPIGSMRPVSTDKCIVLINSTTVMPVPLEVITIPRHKFEIKSIDQIYEIASSYGDSLCPVHAIGN